MYGVKKTASRGKSGFMTSVQKAERAPLWAGREEKISTPKNSRFYRPELDTLRFFAFLAVFGFHVIPHDAEFYSQHHIPSAFIWLICAASKAGAFGVDLFFALSAYLITVLLLRERELKGDIDLKAFYIRRILRIWPVYFFFLAIAVTVSAFDPYHHLDWQYVAGYLLLSGNWVYTWKGLPALIITIPLWSISVEEQFYLVWPLIAKKISLKRMKFALLGLLSLGYISRIVLIWTHASGTKAEYNTFARIDPIVLGIFIALVLRERSEKWSLPLRLTLAGLCFATWAAVAGLTTLNDPLAAAPALGTLLGRPLIALAAAGLLLAFIGAPGAGARVLAHPALTYLGRISYGLYVYHMGGLMLARRILHDEDARGHVERAVLGLAITVVFSMVSYQWLERPFLRLKDRFAKVLSRPA
jgi:peptidoglycan/LPS O-acetylase OafA/YrhL